MISTASAAWLAVAERVARKKARRAIAPQIRHDHAVAGRRQQRRHIDEAVNVVGPAVQKNDGRTIGGTGLSVSDIQGAGIDLLQRCERRGGPRPDRGHIRAASRRWTVRKREPIDQAGSAVHGDDASSRSGPRKPRRVIRPVSRT